MNSRRWKRRSTIQHFVVVVIVVVIIIFLKACQKGSQVMYIGTGIPCGHEEAVRYEGWFKQKQ